MLSLSKGHRDDAELEETKDGSAAAAESKFVVQDWSEDQQQEVDLNEPHCHRSVYVRSVVLNNRFYLF